MNTLRHLSFLAALFLVVSPAQAEAPASVAAESIAPEESGPIDLRFLKPLDLEGKVVSLVENERRGGTAFVFLSPECPISRQYMEELNRIAAAAPDQVPLLGVLSQRSLDRAEATKFAEEAQAGFRIVFDASGELAAMLKPSHLPQVFVVNSQGKVVYRGRIDDRFAAGGDQPAEATRHDLLDAMTALADDQPIEVAATEAIGCRFEEGASVPAAGEVTYNRDIAPILFAHCAECHRPGEVAPFSLLSYEDASKRAEFIGQITTAGVMPPWKAEIGHGHFLDERRLTEQEIALITAWAQAGAPRGHEGDLPPQPQFATGWRLGTPDVVVEAPTTVTVPPDGGDIFHHWVMPIDIPADKTLVGIEFRPGNPAVVHHAIIGLDTTGGSRRRDEETPEPGYRSSGSIEGSMSAFLGVWTPGMTPRFYPEDVGFRIPQQADLLLQLHLHPSGKEETDQSRVALYFADKPAEKLKTQTMFVSGSLIVAIPPGEARHKISSSFTLPIDLTMNSVFPHLHLIGKEVKVTATYPTGEVESLIWIKDWNFYWQDVYVYKQAKVLPKGTKIDIEAYYDNSAENPFNPSSPPKEVLFGNDSDDEMCFILFQTVSEEEQLMSKLGPAMMMSFMRDWNEADLTDEQRAHIADEAVKLFGGGSGRGGEGGRGGEMLKRMMLRDSKQKREKKEKPAAPTEAGGDG